MTNAITASQTTRSPILRKLILAQVAVSVLGPAVAIFDSRLLPLALREYRSASTQHPFSVADGVEAFAYGVCFVLTVIGLVGLWRGRPSAPRTYLTSWLLLLALAFFGHPTVTSGPSMALATLSTLIGGVILGTVFSSDTSLPNATEST
jgi:hypothetical protein